MAHGGYHLRPKVSIIGITCLPRPFGVQDNNADVTLFDGSDVVKKGSGFP